MQFFVSALNSKPLRNGPNPLKIFSLRETVTHFKRKTRKKFEFFERKMAFSGVVKVSDIDDYMDVISTIFDFSATLIFF